MNFVHGTILAIGLQTIYMIQLDVPNDLKVDIDFSDNTLPKSAKMFMPLVFKDGDSYCCILGPNSEEGVFGCGKTPADALKEWDKNLEKKKGINDPDDEVAFYINETLTRNKDQVW